LCIDANDPTPWPGGNQNLA